MRMLAIIVRRGFSYNCPGLPPIEVQSLKYWWQVFYDLHMSEAVDYGNAYLFTPAHSKYKGNQILVEAILVCKAMFWDGVSTRDTWLVMLHNRSADDEKPWGGKTASGLTRIESHLRRARHRKPRRRTSRRQTTHAPARLWC